MWVNNAPRAMPNISIPSNKRTSGAELTIVVFDLLTYGKDLRTERLLDRKQELRRLLAGSPDSLLKYTEYIDGHGMALFQRVCELDLEGVVAKQKFGPYVTDREQSTWYKILNREYSQMQGREELFDRERHSEPVAGWHSCDLALCQSGSWLALLRRN